MSAQMLIDGKRVEGSGASLDVENPYSEQTIQSVACASPEQLDAALVAASEATGAWGSMPAVERADLLHEVATRLRAKVDVLAEVMTLEGGKPLVENRDEIGWTAAAFDYYAELGRDQLANSTRFGLGANVYTRDLATAVRCMRDIKAGTVWINDPLTDNDAGPFGGFKQSGIGRELGREGLEAFQETKHVHIETNIEAKSWWHPYGQSDR